MSNAPVLLWLRQDLRLDDHPALLAACAAGPVIPLYILDEEASVTEGLGGAARWWLYYSLKALDDALRARNSRITLRHGDPRRIIPELVDATGAQAVFWSRCYEPGAIARDRQIKEQLQQTGIRVASHNSSLLFEPWEIQNKSGQFFRVYTPFSKACFARGPDAPAGPAPARLPAPTAWPASDRLEDWALRPTQPDWAAGLRASWQPGSMGATGRLGEFLVQAAAGYKEQRNRPDRPSTSRLSPHLHWGEIAPQRIWQMVIAACQRDGLASPDPDREHFLKELLWREFSYHLLYHVPDLPTAPLNRAFVHFPWAEDDGLLHAWQRGATGYPIIDAGMRELWQTGWMHNRVRMIVASFLVKDLLIPWQRGAAWFWDTLVDADLANNSASWQWVAGCGADAAPYFRIFNPALQAQKFDPAGDYVRRYVPELARLPTAHIHEPHRAPPAVLASAGISLGQDYPAPIIDHHQARDRALAAFARIKAA